MDRTNPRVSRRYDTLNPASLTLIRLIVQSAAENSGDLSLCGEMAGQPLDAMALLGLGLRTLSMQPGQIGPIKMMIRSLNLGEVSQFVDRLCGRTDQSRGPGFRPSPQNAGSISPRPERNHAPINGLFKARKLR